MEKIEMEIGTGIILIENKKSNIGLPLYVKEDLLRHVFN
jgi:hypothetical protein